MKGRECCKLVLILGLVVQSTMADYWTFEKMSDVQDRIWNVKYLAIPDVYGPGIMTADLRPCDANDSDCSIHLAKLEESLNGWHYTKSHEPYAFDCSNSSEILWYFLTTRGYNAKLMCGGNHAWVVVKFGEDKYIPIETTGQYSERLGKIIGPAMVTTHILPDNSTEVRTQSDYLTGWLLNSSMEYSIFVHDSMKLVSSENYDQLIEENAN